MSKQALEINRKIFHVCGMFFPIIYIFLSKLTASILITLCLIIVLYIDVYRHKSSKVQYLVDNFLKFFMRESEKSSSKLSGSSWMFIGLALSCYLYDKHITIYSWCVLFICDALAAIIGMKFGKTQIIEGKTLEGSFTFFFTAIFMGMYYNHLIHASFDFLGILLGSFFATIAEIYSKKIDIDDNLIIPIIMGFFLSVF